MSSPARLSDSDDLPRTDNNDENEIDGGGYGSDEAIEDTNFRDDDDETDESKKRRIDPQSSQKRTVRKPQPSLNAELLKGPKGIHTIEKLFDDFKSRGKGYEKSDLNRLMKKLEYWSHRLFPKFEFDDCLTKLETLGAKKPVQTHLTKIRLGMLTDDVVLNDAGEEQEEEEKVQDSVPIDEFDALIAEELEKNRAAVTPQRQNVSTSFTGLLNQTPKVSSQSSDIEITVEMKEKMERNRQIAIQKRLARIDAEEARKKTLREQEENEEEVDQEMKEQTQPEESIVGE